jgi:hypothetical protein
VIIVDETTREKLRRALLEAADEISVMDNAYEGLDAAIYHLERVFDGEIFEDDVAMEVRIDAGDEADISQYIQE